MSGHSVDPFGDSDPHDIPIIPNVAHEPVLGDPLQTWPISSIAPLSRIIDLYRRWSRNLSVTAFLRNARHKPAILVLGKLRSWSWRCPYLQIPLGMITSVWLLRALNITWWPLWTYARSMDASGAWLVFSLLRDFLDNSTTFRIICAFLRLYIIVLCIGGIGFSFPKAARWSLRRLFKNWSFACAWEDPVSPVVSSPVQSPTVLTDLRIRLVDLVLLRR